MEKIRILPLNLSSELQEELRATYEIVDPSNPHGVMIADMIVGRLENDFSLGYTIGNAVEKYGKLTILFTMNDTLDTPQHPMLTIAKYQNDDVLISEVQRLTTKYFPAASGAACTTEVCAV
ncbi:MAG: hypothetical protein AAB839_01065 [Patescibacteria group bacterium]